MQLFLHLNLTQLTVLVAGYLLTFALSGLVVRLVLGPFPGPPKYPGSSEAAGKRRWPDLGVIIGKCENFLTITLILADQVTGLAVIFAAKSILRAEDMRDNPRYYLGGTLVNLCFSILMGIVTCRCLAVFNAH